MSRVLIYRSDSTQDSVGNAIDQALTTSSSSPKRSVPFRLIGGEELADFGLELLYWNAAAGSLDVRLIVEDFDDRGPIFLPPSARIEPISLAAGAGWPQVVASVLSGGTRTHTVETHAIALALNAPLKIDALSAKANWKRLAVWINGAIPANARLAIWAHLGNHAFVEYLETLTAPYAYNDPP